LKSPKQLYKDNILTRMSLTYKFKMTKFSKSFCTISYESWSWFKL